MLYFLEWCWGLGSCCNSVGYCHVGALLCVDWGYCSLQDKSHFGYPFRSEE